MPVLKVRAGQEDEERELQFELEHQATLTVSQRYELMLRRSREIAEQLIRNGHRAPVALLKRP